MSAAACHAPRRLDAVTIKAAIPPLEFYDGPFKRARVGAANGGDAHR